ncbi:hypothetical protein GGR26_002389 [Lewinella marina]|uniref:DUF3575 domain-containing protein n=1 Tax=Neolewinella marina TaxID=438751 RepID=A0A2G0CG40_9BACT|nr:DUF3575 domain-containing protein [Neolewinella marina]NJB86621.1 hypothetical protein [Neolewinella marina]PHK98928.1 hypothetical protein CGL56_05565 [Neolewinella marina]
MSKFLWLVCCLFLSAALSGQTDAKINVGSALGGGINVAAEFPLGGQSALSVGAAYSSLAYFDTDNEDYRYRSLRLIPEYRYYFAPRAGFDRFFVGGYGKVGRVAGTDIWSHEEIRAMRAAIGMLSGHKWIAPSGFLYELNAGIGRSVTFGGNEDEAVYQKVIGDLSGLDLRLGILVGWRFTKQDPGRRRSAR